jgi:hypothetical protein
MVTRNPPNRVEFRGRLVWLDTSCWCGSSYFRTIAEEGDCATIYCGFAFNNASIIDHKRVTLSRSAPAKRKRVDRIALIGSTAGLYFGPYTLVWCFSLRPARGCGAAVCVSGPNLMGS